VVVCSSLLDRGARGEYIQEVAEEYEEVRHAAGIVWHLKGFSYGNFQVREDHYDNLREKKYIYLLLITV
jgi:hypothetical protein